MPADEAIGRFHYGMLLGNHPHVLATWRVISNRLALSNVSPNSSAGTRASLMPAPMARSSLTRQQSMSSSATHPPSMFAGI
jgi:hypothetical protein